MSQKTYSFGLPGNLVWGLHIIVGGVLFYMGYELHQGRKLSDVFVIGMMIVGTLVTVYHAHLAYLNNIKTSETFVGEDIL